MRPHYTPLPTHDELNAAFENGDDEDDESTPLNRTGTKDEDEDSLATVIPGSYDFERDRDYDVPPPGSPPGPSTFALPNDYGNTNGLIPTSPTEARAPPQRAGFFRRVVGSVLPTHYVQERRQVVGGGIENDGVFANVMAKPQLEGMQAVRSSDGNIHLVPEEVQKEAPPSYAAAQQDAAPTYFETTVVAPAVPGTQGGEMIIEDLPTGSFWVFIINVLISFFFQFIGFLLTFLLHTSHAGKYGSRAGLGLTLIQYGLYSRSVTVELEAGAGPSDGESFDSTNESTVPNPSVTYRDWLSFLLMTLGWFLCLTSCIGYWRVKRWESSILASSEPTSDNTSNSLTREQVMIDARTRQNLEAVFGIPVQEERSSRNREGPPPMHTTMVNEHGQTVVIPSREYLEEMRLARDLRAAGLI